MKSAFLAIRRSAASMIAQLGRSSASTDATNAIMKRQRLIILTGRMIYHPEDPGNDDPEI
jgi:hypothetical protein